MHLQRGVFPKAPRDHIEPRSAGRLVSASNSRHKLAYRSSNASRVNRPRAVLGQGSRHEACMTADPMRNGCAWNRNASEPLWIELDFNLFESDRQGRIAMGRTRAVKDGRRTVNHAPSELGLIQIASEHENRQHRPVMRMLPYPSVAEIDNSADDDTARLVQYVHWQRENPGPLIQRKSISLGRSQVRGTSGVPRSLALKPSNTRPAGTPIKGPKQPVKVNECLRSTFRLEDDSLLLASDGIWRRSRASA